MSFDIKFLRDIPRFREEGQHGIWGQIRIGTFEERFLSYTEFWSESNYEGAWILAVNTLIGGASKSVLVTDAHDPDTGGVAVIWPMYREGEDVFIQNQILLPEVAPRPFTVENVIKQLSPRETVDEDGNAISEWRVQMIELAMFVSRAASR